MWQRIQSVFLGIAILSLIFGLIYPVWSGSKKGIDVVSLDKNVEYKLYPIYFLSKEPGPNGRVMTSTYFPYSITAILIVAAATIAIMEFRRFDNRMLQVKLGTLNSLVLAGVMICDILFSNQMSKAYPVPWKYELSLYLTFVAIVCNWLAIRFIRRDEKMVRDSDRIR